MGAEASRPQVRGSVCASGRDAEVPALAEQSVGWAFRPVGDGQNRRLPCRRKLWRPCRSCTVWAARTVSTTISIRASGRGYRVRRFRARGLDLRICRHGFRHHWTIFVGAEMELRALIVEWRGEVVYPIEHAIIVE